MKKIWLIIPAIAWLVVMLALIFATAVQAAPLHQEPAPAGDIVSIVTAAFSLLLGWPALLAAAINLAKRYGLPEGSASKVNFWANVVAWVGVAYFVFTGQTDALSKLDGTLSGLAKILVDILILTGGAIAHSGLTNFMHNNTKQLPVVGFTAPPPVAPVKKK